jgi:large subunit ribosomal protein L1
MKKGKKYVQAASKVDSKKAYTVEEACALVKETSTVKFDATIDLAINLNVDPRYADQQLRGTIPLPHGNGKTKKIVAITHKHEEAKAAGADFVGDKDLLDKMKNENWLDFDVIVATPEMMGELGKLGKLLGPRGLMPTPKTGTVTPDIAKAISEIKSGKVAYKTDKFGNVHVLIGKASFDASKLADNVNAVVDALAKVRPASVKGQYFKNVTVSTTMGPGIKVAVNYR